MGLRLDKKLSRLSQRDGIQVASRMRQIHQFFVKMIPKLSSWIADKLCKRPFHAVDIIVFATLVYEIKQIWYE